MNWAAFGDLGHYDVPLTLLTPAAIEDQRERALALRPARSVDSNLMTALARLDPVLAYRSWSN